MESRINLTLPTIYLLGSAIGSGANQIGCELGPATFKAYLEQQVDLPFKPIWDSIIEEAPEQEDQYQRMAQTSEAIAKVVSNAINQGYCPINIGGDHSCAIGMWSGVASSIAPKNLGLIWIDAHLDAHTDKTTHTQNIHGMPISALLGHGHQTLTTVINNNPKLKPKNLYLIGIRDYETEEHQFLKQLGVHIDYIEDVKTYGIDILLQRAYTTLSKQTSKIGLSIDLDAIDPKEAPAVGTPVQNGISATTLLDALAHLPKQALIGLEIAEFNPKLDQHQKTLKLIMKIIEAFDITHWQP